MGRIPAYDVLLFASVLLCLVACVCGSGCPEHVVPWWCPTATRKRSGGGLDVDIYEEFDAWESVDFSLLPARADGSVSLTEMEAVIQLYTSLLDMLGQADISGDELVTPQEWQNLGETLANKHIKDPLTALLSELRDLKKFINKE